MIKIYQGSMLWIAVNSSEFFCIVQLKKLYGKGCAPNKFAYIAPIDASTILVANNKIQQCCQYES